MQSCCMYMCSSTVVLKIYIMSIKIMRNLANMRYFMINAARDFTVLTVHDAVSR